MGIRGLAPRAPVTRERLVLSRTDIHNSPAGLRNHANNTNNTNNGNNGNNYPRGAGQGQPGPMHLPPDEYRAAHGELTEHPDAPPTIYVPSVWGVSPLSRHCPRALFVFSILHLYSQQWG